MIIVKTFKYIREEAEKATDADKRKNRFNSSRRMRIRAKQKSFQRKKELAMRRYPTLDVAKKRARPSVKKVLQKKFLGTNSPSRYKDASLGKRIQMDKMLDRKVSPERKDRLVTKAVRKVRKLHIDRRTGKK